MIDDDAIRLSLKLALEDADYLVEEAADGEDGKNRFRTNPADLVITDIFMPEKEGLETIDEIRRECPQTKIIAMSGGGSIGPEDYLEINRRVGADCSFFKPFDIQMLVATVEDLMGPRKK